MTAAIVFFVIVLVVALIEKWPFFTRVKHHKTITPQQMEAILQVLAGPTIPIPDIKALKVAIHHEERKFDALLAETVGSLGIMAVKVGPLNACFMHDPGGQC